MVDSCAACRPWRRRGGELNRGCRRSVEYGDRLSLASEWRVTFRAFVWALLTHVISEFAFERLRQTACILWSDAIYHYEPSVAYSFAQAVLNGSSSQLRGFW